LAQLGSGGAPAAVQTSSGTSTPSAPAAASTTISGPNDPRLQRVRDHLRKYRELVSQGRWSDAGKELEAIENEVKQ
jgi:hypothetical protein